MTPELAPTRRITRVRTALPDAGKRVFEGHAARYNGIDTLRRFAAISRRPERVERPVYGKLAILMRGRGNRGGKPDGSGTDAECAHDRIIGTSPAEHLASSRSPIAGSAGDRARERSFETTSRHKKRAGNRSPLASVRPELPKPKGLCLELFSASAQRLRLFPAGRDRGAAAIFTLQINDGQAFGSSDDSRGKHSTPRTNNSDCCVGSSCHTFAPNPFRRRHTSNGSLNIVAN